MKKEYNFIEKMKYNNKKPQKNKFDHESDVIVKENQKERKVTKKNGRIEEKPFKTKESSYNKVNGTEHRPDSPGIDLSVFAPRGKRKCVIQNEAKKQKTDWWSDEDEDEEDMGEKNGIVEGEEEGHNNADGEGERDRDVLGKDDTKKKSIVGKRKRRKLKNTKENNPSIDENKTTPKTVQCYVFSTGMANRAGNSVHKGRYKTITDYHHSQRWDTPYLNSEVHCRPFHPELEEKQEVKDVEDGLELLPKQEHKAEPKEAKEMNNGTTNIKVEQLKQPLTVDKWRKEQLIQAAQQMNRLSQSRNSDVTKNVTNSLKVENVEKSDTETSPQTVPKYSESKIKDEVQSTPKTTIYSSHNTSNSTVFPKQIFTKPTTFTQDEVRKKERNSPPQLVPSSANSITSSVKSSTSFTSNTTNSHTSYPADITNLKEQLRYNSPKPQPINPVIEQADYRIQTSSIQECQVRPTVLSMVSDHRNKEPNPVRSSLDMAEKEMKESRITYKPGVPILPRDIHPSIFLSRHSPHTSAFNGKPSTTSIPAFPPSTSRSSSGFTAPHELQTRHHLPPSHPGHMSLFRHPLHSRPDYNELESMSDKYKSMTSSFSVYHALNSRPSSLPVMPTAKRPDSHPPQSFSVESLTKNNNDRGIVEKHSPRVPVSAGVERTPIMPEHLREYLAVPDRIHIPTNGINIHNGLKRSLDEQLSNHIMERVKRDKTYIDSLPSERYLHEKERLLYDKERYLQHTRMPFPPHDMRSPMRMPPGYLPQTRPVLTNGNEHSEKSTNPTQQQYPPGFHPHIPRSHPYPYPNR